MARRPVKGGIAFRLMPDTRGFDRIVELPDDGLRQKEVYARFGLVAYQAQVFDHALVNLLTVAGTIGQKLTTADVDRFMADLFQKTAGALVNEVSRDLHLDVADLETCRKAVVERNRLIHRFFREHAENFMTSSGQQRMLDDLGDIADVIAQADKACHHMMMTIGEPHGFTAEVVSEHLEAMERIESSDK